MHDDLRFGINALTRIRQRLRTLGASLLCIFVLSSSCLAASAEEASSDAPSSVNNHSARRDQFVTVDGAKLHYVEAGSGQPVVLLHGNDGTLQDFTMSIFDQMAAKYRTIAVDRPGHGASENPKHCVATPEVQARILHEALKELKVERPLIVAHSWSGAMGLSYALEFPDDLCGLVMLSGMAYDTKQGAARPSYYAVKMPVAGTVLAVVYKCVGRSDVEKQLKQAFYPEPAPKPYLDKFCAQLFRMSQLKAAARDEITLNPCLKKMSPRYPSLDLPLVILCGDQDKLVSPALHSYPLHKAIPNSKLIVSKGAGHELSFTRPQEVMDALALALEMSSSWHKSNLSNQTKSDPGVEPGKGEKGAAAK